MKGEAGVSIYMDEKHHYDMAVRRGDHGVEYVSRICIGGMTDEQCQAAEGDGCVHMEIQSYRDRYVMTVKEDDCVCFERQMASKYLSSEVAGGFTGVFFGLYACGHEDGKEWSEFTDFKLVFFHD